MDLAISEARRSQKALRHARANERWAAVGALAATVGRHRHVGLRRTGKPHDVRVFPGLLLNPTGDWLRGQRETRLWLNV
jgi:hypothetical protein